MVTLLVLIFTEISESNKERKNKGIDSRGAMARGRVRPEGPWYMVCKLARFHHSELGGRSEVNWPEAVMGGGNSITVQYGIPLLSQFVSY
jgi:hypothetical protein